MYRVLILAAVDADREEWAFDHCFPMIGTLEKDGQVIVDALMTEVPDDAYAAWCRQGNVIVPLDAADFTARLAPVVVYDEDGEIISTTPAVLHEPSTWAGWPPVIGVSHE